METAVASRLKVLWVADGPAPANVAEAMDDHYELISAHRGEPLGRQLNSTPLAVIYPDGWANDVHRLGRVLRELDRSPAVAIFLLPPEARMGWMMLSRRRGQFLCVRDDAPPEELSAKLAAAAALQPAFGNLQTRLLAAPGGAAQNGVLLEDLDEELRLAARLQRDFLPRRLPEVGTVRFAALYNPVGWVSGDLYDIFRLDESHVGFYVADAVGHGLPAALLTMFIKKALQTKRIVGKQYHIVQPHAALTELNLDICEQNLSNSPFCTATYCVIDTTTMTLNYARAGHPEPILLRADGSAQALPARGSLLGIFPDEQYETRTLQLAAGDRLVLYTDGIEGVFGPGSDGGPPDLLNLFSSWARLSRPEVMLQINARLAAAPPLKRTADDVTVVIADIGRE